MTSPQAEVFGFPNPLLGVAGFAVVATTGAALLAGGRLAGWYWAGLQVGATAAVVFVHWLMYQSVFVIGALCPYCMIVWAVTISTFVYVTVHNLARHHPQAPRHGSAGARVRVAAAQHLAGALADRSHRHRRLVDVARLGGRIGATEMVSGRQRPVSVVSRLAAQSHSLPSQPHP